MRISIVVEDDQMDKTGKKGRSMMAELRTEEKGLEKIWVAAWLDNKSVLGKEVNILIKEMIKMRKAELKKKDIAQKATDKLIK